MAWEDRNGSQYYYRKRRQGKRVISEYVGGGLVGEMAHASDGEDRHAANMARLDFAEQKERAAVIGAKSNEVERITKAVTRAVLLLSGYHPHKRQWRKRRDVR